MKQYWWKILAILLLVYAISAGLLMKAPDDLGILQKSIRNLHYHVPMWFSMIVLLSVSYIYSIIFLSKSKLRNDSIASSFVNTALLFGLLGLATGSLWARFTWTVWWTADPKLNGAAIGVMIYVAYYILRHNIEDDIKKAKFSAVYTLFAFPIFIVLIIVLPKMAESSLHPGSGDTVGFNQFDLDNDLRKVFYPAVLGWILFSVWIANLRYRITEIKRRHENN